MELTMLFIFMMIGLLGIGSQWLAWKFNMPAIVVMSIAGLIVGPFLGIMNPEESFGDLYRPVISVAVAIILFEGSIDLNRKEVSEVGKPLFRIATIGAFIAWILGSLTAHYMAGLSWEVAFVIGGLFVVTGPTVIMPLLRQSKLKPRVATILKWEGIVVDPLGVLLAVFAFEIITFFTIPSKSVADLLFFFFIAILATLMGWAGGHFIGWLFEGGRVPEFLKSPVVFSFVILIFAIPDEIIQGTGLLAVTALGMTLANIGINSLHDFRHFKENLSVLLISAIFIMLAASLELDTIIEIFQPNIIGYVLLMMFIVRPLSIFISTIRTDLSLQERALVGWIAPRGIVALTVSSYFASILLDAGYEDAKMLTTLTFGLVFFTVVVHGFTLGPLAKRLNLSLEGNEGVLIVGSNKFTIELAQSLQKVNSPVLVVDNSWRNLKLARQAGVPFHYGEILSEQTEYNLDTIPYDIIVTATVSHSYNSLICTAFLPEYGRASVFKVDPAHGENEKIAAKIGGRSLCKETVTLQELIQKLDEGYTNTVTELSEQFTYKDYLADKDKEALSLYYMKPSGHIRFFASDMQMYPQIGDKIVTLAPMKIEG